MLLPHHDGGGNFSVLRIVFPVGTSSTPDAASFYNTSLNSEQNARAHNHRGYRRPSSSDGSQEEEVSRGEVPGKEKNKNTVPFPLRKLHLASSATHVHARMHARSSCE